MSCDVGHRRGLDPKLLWLWRRPVAAARIQPLAWESPYAKGAALEKAKKKKSVLMYTLSPKEIITEVFKDLAIMIFHSTWLKMSQKLETVLVQKGRFLKSVTHLLNGISCSDLKCW